MHLLLQRCLPTTRKRPACAGSKTTMMLYPHLTLACLLQLWLVYAPHKDSLVPVFSLRRTTVLTVLMLLLAVSLSTLVKKPALASEPDPYGPWARLLERVTPTTQESFPSTRCFNLPLEVAAKAACEMEPLHCTILYGIWKSKTCLCLKTIKERTTTESDIWTMVCNSTN